MREKAYTISVEAKTFTVLDLIDLDLKEHNALNLRCAAGRQGLSREITSSDLNRPGLALSGFFDVFSSERVQLFGRGETAFLEKLERENNYEAVRRFFTFDIPCCVFSFNYHPGPLFMSCAEAGSCPILVTDLTTTSLASRLMRILSNIFAPRKTIHGVLVEVYGVGVLLLGDSGVGKSETALELIKHGHRLVADDVVEIHCINGNILLGTGANKIISHHMEIRGIGVINVTHLFGVAAIRDRKQIQLVVTMENWDTAKNYDRLGVDEQYMDILGVKIHHLVIPVKPGRNVPIIVETAAMNERLKNMGYDAAKEFHQNVLKWIESESAKSVFFGQSDII